MKQLNPLQNIIFQLGGILVIVGIVLWTPRMAIAPYLFCLGTFMFASMQMLCSYEGSSFIIKCLRRQQVFGALCLVASGIMMIGGTLHWRYMSRNEWILALTIAAVFDLYTAFRIPMELKKES